MRVLFSPIFYLSSFFSPSPFVFEVQKRHQSFSSSGAVFSPARTPPGFDSGGFFADRLEKQNAVYHRLRHLCVLFTSRTQVLHRVHCQPDTTSEAASGGTQRWGPSHGHVARSARSGRGGVYQRFPYCSKRFIIRMACQTGGRVALFPWPTRSSPTFTRVSLDRAS